MNVAEALHRAVSSLAAGDLGQTKAICGQVLEVQRNQPDALHLLGVIALQQCNHQNAVDLIQKAIQENENNPSFFSTLGEAYRGLGQIDHAISAFERALEINPSWAAAHGGLGNAFANLGEIDRALASYERAIEIDPNMTQIHYNLGNAHAANGDLENAVAAYRRSIALNPTFADSHYNLANVLQVRGELISAVASYEDVVEIAPGFADAWYNMGNALRKLERLDAARQAYERALALNSSLAGAHLHLGTIAKVQARLDDALRSFNRAIEIEPTFAAAHSGRAHVYLIQGNTEDAIAGFRHAIELDPKFAWGYIGLSSALAEADRIPEAREASQGALQRQRTIELPAKGRNPIGRVLILKGIESTYFRINPDDDLIAIGGMNNADFHFDRTRFHSVSFYIDGFDPRTEAELLPACDVIFNAISDVDSFPMSQEIATMIAADASVPVINPPEIVARTQRHKNYQSLHELEGIVFPATVRLEERLGSRSQIVACLDEAGISLPVLVRRVGTHSARSLEKADDIEQLEAYFERHREGPYYIVAFRNFLDRQGHYVKMRMFFIDGAMYPNHFLVSKDWKIDVTPEIYDLMSANDWMLGSAKQFHADPESFLGKDAYHALASIHSKLSLDYFGVDFTQLDDGRIFVFEANATMRIPYIASGELDPAPYRKPSIEAIIEALSALLEKKIEASKSQIL